MVSTGMAIVVVVIITIIYLLAVIYNSDGYELCSYANNYLVHCESRDIYNTHDHKWTEIFRQKYKEIYAEFLNYQQRNYIPRYADIDRVQFTLDNDTATWKTLFLRLYNKDTENIKYFPVTMNLINDINCTSAMFSIIEPHKIIPEHAGVYAGVLRYHLGLKVPREKHNCFITINNKKLVWHEGKDLLFDDTYPHHVENNTNETRIVLFLDIVKEFNNPIANAINKLVINAAKNNATVIENVNKINTFIN